MSIYRQLVLADTKKSAAGACAHYLRSLNLQSVVCDEKYSWRDEELHLEVQIDDKPSAVEVDETPSNALVQWQSVDNTLWFDLGFVEIEATCYGLLTISDRRLKDLYDTLHQRGLRPLDFVTGLFKSSGCKSILAFAEFSYADLNALHRCMTQGQRLTGLGNLWLVAGALAAEPEAGLSEITLVNGIEIRSKWPSTNARE